MLITETVERECCAIKDLVEFKGLRDSTLDASRILFCQHCGQLWNEDDDPEEESRKMILRGEVSTISKPQTDPIPFSTDDLEDSDQPWRSVDAPPSSARTVEVCIVVGGESTLCRGFKATGGGWYRLTEGDSTKCHPSAWRELAKSVTEDEWKSIAIPPDSERDVYVLLPSGRRGTGFHCCRDLAWKKGTWRLYTGENKATSTCKPIGWAETSAPCPSAGETTPVVDQYKWHTSVKKPKATDDVVLLKTERGGTRERYGYYDHEVCNSWMVYTNKGFVKQCEPYQWRYMTSVESREWWEKKQKLHIKVNPSDLNISPACTPPDDERTVTLFQHAGAIIGVHGFYCTHDKEWFEQKEDGTAERSACYSWRELTEGEKAPVRKKGAKPKEWYSVATNDKPRSGRDVLVRRFTNGTTYRGYYDRNQNCWFRYDAVGRLLPFKPTQWRKISVVDNTLYPQVMKDE